MEVIQNHHPRVRRGVLSKPTGHLLSVSSWELGSMAEVYRLGRIEPARGSGLLEGSTGYSTVNTPNPPDYQASGNDGSNRIPMAAIGVVGTAVF